METKERAEAESNKMTFLRIMACGGKGAFNQYFNGKDFRSGFRANSLKVNTLATGFN